MFGRKKMRETNETQEEYDLRKRIYVKIAEKERINIDQLVQEIETEYIHKDEIENKLNFLVTTGFVRKQAEEGTDYYRPVE